MADFESLSSTAQQTSQTVSNTLSGVFNYTTSGFKIGIPGGGNILNVTIPQIQIFNNLVQELKPPNLPFGNLVWQDGAPTIPPMARGVVNGSIVNTTNNNLFHNCGFLTSLGFAGLTADVRSITSSITQIINTIKYPRKYGAAALIRFTMFSLSNYIRQAINLLLNAVNLDTTGFISQAFSEAKRVLRYIAAELRKAAKLVRDVAMISSIATNLNQILNYIKGLPKQIMAILQNCLLTFVGSVKQLASAVQTLPGVTNNSSATAAFKSVQQNTNAAANTVTSSASTANVHPTIVNAVNNPSPQSASDLNTHITTTGQSYGNTANSSSYNNSNKSQP